MIFNNDRTSTKKPDRPSNLTKARSQLQPLVKNNRPSNLCKKPIALPSQQKLDRITNLTKTRSHFCINHSKFVIMRCIFWLKIQDMTIYNDILNQIETLSFSDQNRLFQELKKRLNNLENIEDDFTEEDLYESESEWQEYVKGNNKGKLLQEIELELFGGEIE